MKEGILKFDLKFYNTPLNAPLQLIDEMNRVRTLLLQKKYIGVDSYGVGYGNLSIRHENSGFLITGSQTARCAQLSVREIALVKNWNLENNFIYAEGETLPSSESLTHGAIYQSCPDIKAVIHIHQLQLWKMKSENMLATPPQLEYGTQSLAQAIARLLNNQKTSAAPPKLGITMTGHEGGLLFWSSHTLIDAYRKIETLEKEAGWE
jgi:ribulose-5-phosphate 4-epimerase/fuculose-1-phosphate aldolase